MNFRFHKLFSPDFKLNIVTDWIFKIIVLNFLWFVFSGFVPAGLLILIFGISLLHPIIILLIAVGIGPATTSLFYLFKNYLKGTKEISLLKTFWNIYINSFIKISVLTIIMLVIGLSLVLNTEMFRLNFEPPINYIGFFFASLILIHIIIFIHLFPVYLKFKDEGLKMIMKKTFIYSFLNPHYSLFILFITILLSLVLISPLPFVFVYPSGLILILTWITEKSFSKIKEKLSS